MWDSYIAAALASRCGKTPNVSHDPRPLSAGELHSFCTAACSGATDKDHICNPQRCSQDKATDWQAKLSLVAVAYGSFTRSGADQAYVTYHGNSEPHAANFGGGILFERRKLSWQVLGWYPGGQMDHCVALPSENTQRMLCLQGYEGQGEIDSSVWLMNVSSHPDPKWSSQIAVLKAQDATNVGDPRDGGGYQCSLQRRTDEAILFKVDHLRRAVHPGCLAEADIHYAKPRDATVACRKNRLAQVHITHGSVQFCLQDGRIRVIAPEHFAKTDY